MTLLTDWEPAVKEDTGPSIPHSREAEEAVLGCVLIDENCFYELSEFLKADHFYIHRHKWLWEAFVRMEARRSPIDMLTVAEELDRKGQLEEIGGPAFLTTLVNQVPTSINAVSYGRIVEGKAIDRKLIESANEIAKIGYDSELDTQTKLTRATDQVTNLAIMKSGHNFVSIGQLLSDVYDETELRAKDPKDVWGLSTGFSRFDHKTGGVQLGELVYVAGSPGVGKTWLDFGWGMHFGEQAPGAIISLEMKRGSVGRRIMSGVTGVSTRSMKSGRMESKDWAPMTKAVEKFAQFPVYIDDSSYDSVGLRAALTYAKREWGLKWFILDYALLMLDKGKDETEQTKVISANLKRIVHDLNIAGVVLHSVTKVGMGMNEEPTMSDQRGSGQAIHDADVQLFLTPVFVKDPDIDALKPEDRKRMCTLWCSKGRELEESKFRIHLVRQGKSPFWGEWDPHIREPEYDYAWQKYTGD